MSAKLYRIFFVLATITALFMINASAASIGIGTVNTGALRLRTDTSTEADVIDTAFNGDIVILLEEVGDWYLVSFNDSEGYMHSDYLTAETVSDKYLGEGYINTSVVNLRQGPGTDTAVLNTLSEGSSAEIVGFDSGWFKVSCRGDTGYILSDYIDLMSNNSADSISGNAVSYSEADALLAYAKEFIGTPYVYGGSSPSGFDCSGFTSFVFKDYGYNLKRTAADQLENGYEVSRDELLPGDLVFFKATSEAASHVGIYMGDNQFIHAASTGIRISSMNSDWYATTYVGARRILD